MYYDYNDDDNDNYNDDYNLSNVLLFALLMSLLVSVLVGCAIYLDYRVECGTFTRPEGLIKVYILERCHDGENAWYLLETEDGQRCYTTHHRGRVGDRYYAWPEDLEGYRPVSDLNIED